MSRLLEGLRGGLGGAILRGIRARGLLSAGSVLLTALAVGSAVLGPVFQVAVTKSYVVARLNEAPTDQTGLSRSFAPDRTFAGGPAEAAALLGEYAASVDEGPFEDPTFQYLTDPAEGGLYDPDGRVGEVRLLASDGACDHLVVEGRCPAAPGEALVLAGDLEYAGGPPSAPGEPASELEIGDRVDLGPRLPAVTLVGTYRVDPAESDHWYDLDRLVSRPRSLPEPPETQPLLPYRPAPLIVTTDSFDAVAPTAWSVFADRRIDVPPDWTESDLSDAGAASARVADEAPELAGGTITGDPLLDLGALLTEVRGQQDTARSSIAPAVLSLVLVALALLLRLLLAASELRLPELALASLRGMGERQLWWLGLIEPLVLLVVSVPVGIVLGLLGSLALVRTWLVPGLPLPLPGAAFLAAGLVAVAAVGVAVLAVGLVLRTSLSTQLTGLRRPQARGRAAVVVELVLVAGALAMLASKLTAGAAGEPDVTDMILPVVLAVVGGLAATRAIAALARRRSRRTSSRSLAGFVSARALGRRSESTLVILPISAAIAVSVFAFGVQDSAAQWRASVAATTSPAAELWRSPLTMPQTVRATHEIDPDGTALMAAARFQVPTARLSVVDAPRLAAVADWPAEWTPGRDVATVQSQIESRGYPPRLAGRTVGLTLTNDLEADDELVVLLKLRTAAGETTPVFVGPFGPGTSTVSRETPDCGSGCEVESMVLGAGAGQRMTMSGEVRIEAFLADEESVTGAVTGPGWGESLGAGLADVSTVSLAGEQLVVDIDTGGAPGLARLAPGDLPLARPVIQGVGDSSELVPTEDGDPALEITGTLQPVDVVGTADSTPFLGPAGTLIDYRMLVSDRLIYDQNFDVYVAVAGDAPAATTEALGDRGFILETTLDRELQILDQGAYALALRLYGVVAVLVLMMAFAGLVVSTAVQLPTRRRDAASLRVVGVPRRAVISAVARELLTVLGGAAVAGILAGSLAQYVVLRTVRLGYVDDLVTPRLVAGIDLRQVALVAVLAALAFGVFAFANAALTVRGARGSTLRESAR